MHVAVIGAGAFGGWTALHLLRRGSKVTLLDAWGAGHSRASSGGETRIIRCAYGNDNVSARFAKRAFELWRESEREWGIPLLIPSGMLFLAKENEPFLKASAEALTALGIPFERFPAADAAKRFPQFCFDGIEVAFYEPGAGVLTARRNCRLVTERFVSEGGDFRIRAVRTPCDASSIELADGSKLNADRYVFACGPWLPRLFPHVLSNLIRPTKQDVMFLSTPPGADDFAPGRFPCWFDMTSENVFYGIPDVENRGFKLAPDLRGPAFDPDTGSRAISEDSIRAMREFVARRFPSLETSALAETRVCQYENSPDFAFVIDQHPENENVWFAGGGSGHGYKHGPAVGEYIADVMLGTRDPEPAFAISRFKVG
jgi:monomeric sarcosine oxidase